MSHSQLVAGGARVVASEHTMKLPDGTELFYRAWLPVRRW